MIHDKYGVGRTLAITLSGNFALCPPASEDGDVVVVFPGVAMPWLLRRQEARKYWYLMIGPVYVHGFMDGEAIDRFVAGKYTLQEFIID